MPETNPTPSISNMYERFLAFVRQHGSEDGTEGHYRIATAKIPEHGEVDVILGLKDGCLQVRNSTEGAAYIEFEADGSTSTRAERHLSMVAIVLRGIEQSVSGN